MSGDLHTTARRVVAELRLHGFTHEDQPDRQALALAEEVGEFVGAYRRWRGQARRPGPVGDVVEELADVVITAYVTAAEFGWDLDAAVADKLEIIFTRGWRAPEEDAANVSKASPEAASQPGPPRPSSRETT